MCPFVHVHGVMLMPKSDFSFYCIKIILAIQYIHVLTSCHKLRIIYLFIYSSFNNAVSNSYYTVSNGEVISE
jgi:hypothetical protein